MCRGSAQSAKQNVRVYQEADLVLFTIWIWIVSKRTEAL